MLSKDDILEECSQRGSPSVLGRDEDGRHYVVFFQTCPATHHQGLGPRRPPGEMSHTSRPAVPLSPPWSPVVPLFPSVKSHRGSLVFFLLFFVETYFWHYCSVTHTIGFFSLHQTLSYIYTSGTIEDTSLHLLHSSFIIIVRSTYLSRSQMVDSQGCSPFSLR